VLFNVEERAIKPKKGIENVILTGIKKKAGPLSILLFLCVFLALKSPNFLTLSNMTNILQQIPVYGLISISLTYVLLLGMVDLSIGSTVAFSGCMCVFLIDRLQFNPFLAILVTLIMSAGIGLINGSILAFTTLPPFIVTLSTQMIIRGTAYIFTDGYPVSSENETFNNIGTGRLTFNVFGTEIQIPYTVFILIAMFIIFGIILHKTKFGRHIYAVGGNREAAIHAGINVKKVRMVVYSIGACLAGLAGILLASRMRSGQPTTGVGFEGEAIASAVLGGVSFGGGLGSISCTIIGTFIMGVINNGLNMLRLQSFYQLLVKGMVILLSVYYDSIRGQISMKALKRKKSAE